MFSNSRCVGCPAVAGQARLKCRTTWRKWLARERVAALCDRFPLYATRLEAYEKALASLRRQSRALDEVTKQESETQQTTQDPERLILLQVFSTWRMAITNTLEELSREPVHLTLSLRSNQALPLSEVVVRPGRGMTRRVGGVTGRWSRSKGPRAGR